MEGKSSSTGDLVGVGMFVATVIGVAIAYYHWQVDERAEERAIANEHGMQKPVIPDLEFSAARALCRGCPSDHTTYEVTLTNNSESTIDISQLRFSTSEVAQYPEPLPNRSMGTEDQHPCTECRTFLVDPATIKHGVSLDEPVDLCVPAHESREFRIQFRLHKTDEARWAIFFLEGTLIAAGNGREARLKLQPFGADETGILKLFDFGSSALLN